MPKQVAPIFVGLVAALTIVGPGYASRYGAVALAALALLRFANGMRPRGADVAAVALVGWALASQLWATDAAVSWVSWKDLAGGATIFVATRLILDTAKSIRLAVLVFLGGCLWAVFRLATYDAPPSVVNAPGRTTIEGVNTNHLAYALSLGVIFIALVWMAKRPDLRGRLSTYGFIAVVALLVLGIELTGTRGALAALVALAAWVALWRIGLVRTLRPAVAAFLVVQAAIALGLLDHGIRSVLTTSARETGTLNGRLDYWPSARAVFGDNPLIGVGLDGFIGINGGIAAHNVVLDLGTGLGLIGLSLFGLWLYQAMVVETRTADPRRRALVVGGFVVLMTPVLGSGYWHQSPSFWIAAAFISLLPSIAPAAEGDDPTPLKRRRWSAWWHGRRLRYDTAAGSETPRKRYDIQGLRAVAVLLVILSHAKVPHLEGGFVGVDVFFVISGFLITGLLIKSGQRTGRTNLVEFYARRALRIVPVAALVLVVTAALASRLLAFAQARETVIDSVWAMFFTANIRFAQVGNDYFAQDQPPSPLQHYWSLAVEEQFYLVWPLLLAALLLGARVLRRSPTDWRPGPREHRRLLIGVAALTAASLTWSIVQTQTEPTNAYFSSLTRAWELGIGAAVAVAATALARVSRWLRLGLGWAGLAGIVASSVFFTEQTPFPSYTALLPVLSTAGILVAGMGGDERGANRLLGLQPLRYVGDVSYSLYLWHWPVLLLAAAWWGEELNVGTNLALMVGAFVLSVFSYHLVEERFRHGSILRPNFEGMTLTWVASSAAVLLVAWVLSTSIEERVATARANEAAPMIAADGTAGADSAGGSPKAAQFVVDAVGSAQRGDKVPKRTSPTLEVAAADWDTLGACSGFERSPSEIEPCQIGDEDGKLRVLLYGDSHAEMWVPAFRAIGASEGIEVYPFTKPGCGIVTQNRETRPDCDEWWEWAQDEIRDLKPDVAVMVHHAYERQDGKTWYGGTAEEGQWLLEFVDRVVVLGGSPVLSEPPTECLQARNATLLGCASPPNEQVAQVNEWGPRLEKLGLEYFPTSQWFCTEDLCPAVMGNVIPYVDTNHMTATFSEELAPALSRMLRLTDQRPHDESRHR